MADTMTNEQIMSEFEELFGTGSEPDEEETKAPEETPKEVEDKPEEETTEETSETEEEKDEEQAQDESKDESDSQQKTPPVTTKQSKQNYAFAELRNQNKKNEQFIRGLGKLVGLDNNASVDDIKDKIKEVLIAKEAKDNNISIELAKRLDAYESDKQELERVKLEKKVQEDFSELIDKHNLDEEAVNEFTSYLIEHGKNPMVDKDVDIESEYLKLHYEDMVQAAVADALAKEEARRKKVEDKAASGVSKSPTDKGEHKISTIKELDDLFANTDL